jgi:putative FmdB family regulatory protein
MPTYQYVCTKCKHEFELFQAITDKPLTVCPQAVCPHQPWGRGKVKRRISGGAGLLFKGSGFYATDYRSEGYKQAVKKESESTTPKKEGAKASDAGSDAKTTSAAKPKPDSA